MKAQALTITASVGIGEGDCSRLERIRTSSVTAEPVLLPDSGIEVLLLPVCSGACEVLGAVAVGPVSALSSHTGIASEIDALISLVAMTIEQSHLVDELNYRVEHDSLTGLFDWPSMERRLFEALTDAQSAGSRMGLIIIGIDRLQRVNAALGHRMGNTLLRQFAQRFQKACAPDSTLGRGSADEFLVLIPRLNTPDEAAGLAERLLESIRPPFLLADRELKVTASAGISISSPEAFRAEDLEARAYAALDHMQSLGGNRSAFFDCSMVTVSAEYLELETRLRGALAAHELLLYYQPQLDLLDSSVVGVEALLRWNHPDLGLVAPSSFIPIAEQGGLIGEIGEWALEEALRQVAVWKKSGSDRLRMSVNVSPLQFRNRDFARRTLEIVERAGFDPGTLLLEITESAVMQDLDHACAQMNRLREGGIQFAIDDFATGYSSLQYLQKLPADKIKIDRSFVHEITSAGKRPRLLENILRLASELELPAIAEGIETREQADVLTAMGCREGQGFLFSTPLDADGMTLWIEERRAHAHPTTAAARLHLVEIGAA